MGATRRQTDALVTAGLWEKVPGGFTFHDWNDYQPTSAQVREERSAAAQRMRERRAKRKGVSQEEPAGQGDAFARTPPERTPNVPEDTGRTYAERSPRVRDVFSDPDPTRPSPDPTRPDPSLEAPGETPGQRVNRLAHGYTDIVKLSRFPAVAGVVKAAVNAGKTDTEIAQALGRLAAEGRSVTVETLRIEIEGRPPGGARQSTTDQRVNAALQLAAQLEATPLGEIA